MGESGNSFYGTKTAEKTSRIDLLENWIIAMWFLNVTIEIDILVSNI